MATKTTVYLYPADYANLQRLAEARGVKTAYLVREAVREYALRYGDSVAPKSIGIGRSRAGDLSERAEELLEGMGQGGPQRPRRSKR
jgi:predicted transcriptional regulator